MQHDHSALGLYSNDKLGDVGVLRASYSGNIPFIDNHKLVGSIGRAVMDNSPFRGRLPRTTCERVVLPLVPVGRLVSELDASFPSVDDKSFLSADIFGVLHSLDRMGTLNSGMKLSGVVGYLVDRRDGFPHESLEVKNGFVYVNGVSVDPFTNQQKAYLGFRGYDDARPVGFSGKIGQLRASNKSFMAPLGVFPFPALYRIKFS